VPELVEEIIHPGALETKSQLEEDLGEMKSQLSKQVTRVRELRIKKVEQPGMGVLAIFPRLIPTLRFDFVSQRHFMATKMWIFTTSM
jgi:hypothetical protein